MPLMIVTLTVHYWFAHYDMLPTSIASESRRSSSTSSFYTTTSSSTQWGPGALAGKAVLALGKAVVRGAEYLVISRRISAIKATMPCSDDHISQFRNLERMFDELLELSRPGLYPDDVHAQAMRTILVQIAIEQTHHLRLGIAKWEIPHAELVEFLSEIGAVAIFWKRGFPDPTLVKAYMTALPNGSHPWSPCIGFVAAVAQLNKATFHAVLSARFLEMVLWAAGAQIHAKKTLESQYDDAFNILSHPASSDLHILWTEKVLEIGGSIPSTTLYRLVDEVTIQDAWPVVECRLLEPHARAMLKTAVPFISPDHEMLRQMAPYGIFQATPGFFEDSQQWAGEHQDTEGPSKSHALRECHAKFSALRGSRR
ncbi:hypothetical protein B0H17DRAFT_566082 [Mycena rosella]|uniref:Uncharacterized protein n=1 Tax=Mycena rosella TaxID=1033263 RepID=A0AAD7GEY0_MYCRO|nr:hypothetical protein B0H17DRAFT_566082 [Mycena rosella]